MTPLLASLAILAGSVESVGDGCAFRALRWSGIGDTMRLEFEFSARPKRYRVRPGTGSGGRSFLFVEFSGSRIDSVGRGKLPGWVRSRQDSGIVSFGLGLDRQVPWRAFWRAEVLRVEIIDRIHRRPLWMEPWVLGLAGAGLAGGGFAIWALSGEESAPTSGGDGGVIPPPGFSLPGR